MIQKRIECKITGRVQMVMYRDFAQRKAGRLGIVGTVENLQDGSVSVVAEGEEEALKKLIALLHKGPLFAKVERVDVKWEESSRAFSDFTIAY